MKKSLIFLAALTFMFAACNKDNEPSSGGDEGEKSTIKWEYNSAKGTLTATGKGAMEDFKNPADFEFYSKREYINKIILPEGLTNIGKNAFYNFFNVESIEIPSTVTKIADNAFAKCTSLNTIIFPSKLASIGDNAFAGCVKLVNADLSSTRIKQTGTNSFRGCTKLEAVILPETLETISENTFNGCSLLATVRHNGSSEAFALPSAHLDVIEDSAFYKCTSLPFMILPSGFYQVGNSAFQGCTSLVTANLQSSGLKKLGAHAFEECKALRTVYWASSIKNVPDYAFNECSELYEVKTFNNVETIGTRAFRNCNMLRLLTFPSTVKSVGSYAFHSCGNLPEINLPNCETIGEYAFAYCKMAYTITLSDKLKRIEEATFYSCGRVGNLLTNITIPASVEYIGKSAFQYCVYLKTIKCYATTPPTLGADAFSSIENKDSRKLYVPSGKKETYGSSSAWGSYFHYNYIYDTL